MESTDDSFSTTMGCLGVPKTYATDRTLQLGGRGPFWRVMRTSQVTSGTIWGKFLELKHAKTKIWCCKKVGRSSLGVRLPQPSQGQWRRGWFVARMKTEKTMNSATSNSKVPTSKTAREGNCALSFERSQWWGSDDCGTANAVFSA